MKKNNYFLLALPFILSLLWLACATSGVLTGGPRDETPPQLMVEESSQNFQTNTEERKFYLEFDEYVKVEDVFNQVVVSPPLVYNPKVEARGRRVNFEFNEKEKLKDSTTYTINFGEAIRDLNEGNKAEGLRFVFSTGDIIDSLTMSGIIVDAITGDPVDKAVALLYDDPNDSMVIKDRPYYFGRADKSGRFTIENIRAGTYQLVGLKDENQNYKFDDPKEKVGYIDSLLPINGEVPDQKIAIFAERQKSFIEKVDSTSRGLLKVAFKEDLFLPKLEIPDTSIITLVDIKQKEILIWHYAQERTRWWLYINQEDGSQDSIRIWSYPLDSTMTNSKITCSTAIKNRNTQHPDSSFYIGFSPPLKEVQGDRFTLTSKKDSTYRGEAVLLDGIGGLIFDMGFEALNMEGDYTIVFNKGELTDIYNRVLDTTLTCPVKMLDRETYSNLSLTIDGFKQEVAYVLRLMLKEKILKEWRVKETESWTGTFPQLKPDDYEIYVLEDMNQNGRWDAGHFLERRQPERDRKLKVTDLRPNWDVELDLTIADWYSSSVQKEDEDNSNNEDEEEGEEGG